MSKQKSKSKGPHPAKIKDAMFSSEDICVVLKDGRRVVLPLANFPALESADFQARNDWQFAEGATALTWPKLELTITTEEILKLSEA